MNEAQKARKVSDEMFLLNYPNEIKYIQDNIESFTLKGLRSAWVEKSSEWASDNIEETQRLIQHFEERGFDITKITVSGLMVTAWSGSCKGIKINW